MNSQSLIVNKPIAICTGRSVSFRYFLMIHALYQCNQFLLFDFQINGQMNSINQEVICSHRERERERDKERERESERERERERGRER